MTCLAADWQIPAMSDVYQIEAADIMRDLLARGVARYGSKAALAKQVGVTHNAVYAWHDGSMPALDKYLKLVELVGDEPNKLFTQPAEEPPPSPSGTIRVIARIAASSANFTVMEDEYAEHVDADVGTFARAHTEYGNTGDPTVLALVQGDSMAPYFRDGSYAIMRRWNARRRPPRGTIAAVRIISDEGFTLKKLQFEQHGVLLLPLNQEHDAMLYKPDQIEISWVALGVITLTSKFRKAPVKTNIFFRGSDLIERGTSTGPGHVLDVAPPPAIIPMSQEDEQAYWEEESRLDREADKEEKKK